eukprot:gene31106-37593_t
MEPVRAPMTNPALLYKSINLVPSHVRVSLSRRAVDVDVNSDPVTAASPSESISHIIGQSRKNLSDSAIPAINSIQLIGISDTDLDSNSDSRPSAFLETGQMPNVLWRRIPMEHLRKHPLYQALPDPSRVSVRSVTELGLYAQDSWQWDALHQGRLTTSALASILGFFEADVAASLQIPRSLRGHDRAVQAWERVREKPPASYAHLFRQGTGESSEERGGEERAVWSFPSDNAAFACAYRPPTAQEPARNAGGWVGASSFSGDPRRVRLQWGDCQEATAVLAALNFLHHSQPQDLASAASSSSSGALLRESGMLLLEALEEYARPSTPLYRTVRAWVEEGSLPLIGASPDGLLVQPAPFSTTAASSSDTQKPAPQPLASSPTPLRSGGAIYSVLEVKCVSPFVAVQGAEGGARFGVAGGRPGGTGVPVWHLPQLQLEMFCAGSACSSALIVTLFVDGARIYKVQRDDQYILDMLGHVRQFYVNYVTRKGAAASSKKPVRPSSSSNKMKPPAPNFVQPRGSYLAFLQRTKQLAQQAELLADLDASSIQRSDVSSSFFKDNLG